MVICIKCISINCVTYRFQLFPRTFNVLLCLTSIMEMLLGEVGRGRGGDTEKNINFNTSFIISRDLKAGEPDFDMSEIIN